MSNLKTQLQDPLEAEMKREIIYLKIKVEMGQGVRPSILSAK